MAQEAVGQVLENYAKKAPQISFVVCAASWLLTYPPAQDAVHLLQVKSLKGFQENICSNFTILDAVLVTEKAKSTCL